MEDDDVGGGNGGGAGGGEDGGKDFGLGDDPAGGGDLDVVGEFERRVGRVAAGKDGSCSDNREGEHHVVNVVEGVEKDTIAGLDSLGTKSRDELLDDMLCLR